MSSLSVAPAVSAAGVAAARPAGPPPHRLLEQFASAYATCTTAYGRRKPSSIELLGHSDVSTTLIYTHVLKVAGGAVRSPLDALLPA